LAEIWSYIATEASEAIATRLIKKIEEEAKIFCHFPLSGPARDQIGKGMRIGFSGNYAIYYVATESELIIVRVLHGARDAMAISSSGGFLDETKT
jgi:toxin ParE1/3/4